MKSSEEIRRVTDALVAVQGVADIGVNDCEVEVRFDAGKTNEAAIRAALASAGHEPPRA
jgi:copper chaperone CopZ